MTVTATARLWTESARAGTWAVASGVTGLVSNGLLVAFFAVEAGRDLDRPMVLGPLNDITGSLGIACLVPAVLVFGPRPLRLLGLGATAVLAIGGPALVAGLVSFERQVPVMMAAYAALSAWTVWLCQAHRDWLPQGLRRLGLFTGGGALAGMAIAAAGLALPSGSAPQYTVFALAALPGLPAWFATPVFFLQLGRRLRHAPPPAR